MDDTTIIAQRDSASWLFFVRAAFGISLASTVTGLLYLPVDLWVKGYMAMGLFFTIGSTITLSKTLRDEHEAKRLLNRIAEAKTSKLLKEYDPA
ncbi:MAG TPA: YiaA/YiaB family inner membrane protein [Gemmatimonadaceae bacterium]|nr:YiaA/YiaB family inner membrane protein [Gemmatimonadaceae bacterium]